jgi:putative membrane-bound dehydrogenase-like protein
MRRPQFDIRFLLLFNLFLALVARGESPLPDAKRLETSPVLRHLKRNPMPALPKAGPEETVAQMYLPEGFRAELVVGEPDLQQPVAFAFDERGRIWVAEAYSYPQKRPAGEGMDKIVIFEDKDGDGKFETRKVFAEGLNLVSGFEVGYGGVWVGAAPELLFIPDRDHDDVPDRKPEVLLDGFGYQDTHECLNSFLWGPDGWLYGNQGVFNLAHIGKPGAADSERTELRAGIWRYHPVRHVFEVFAEGGSNQWGLDYDERGQIFMTHCRSYWGRGGTTHVIQGGRYWNQANANYPAYIVAEPPKDFPAFKNYMLASARYDHGAGGAGVPGSDAIYGGHSHVGTMIYLGDNWPDEYRGHLFTHNLHGHQINQQVNRRWGSGFDTVHAGRDQFFCSDPKYVAVDLQYGPDGAVYMIDWYDQQHCHNPNTERWDRSNGRIYRMQWDATYKPVKVNLAQLDDAHLVELHGHKNEWFVRAARRLLHERAQKGPINENAVGMLGGLFANHLDPAIRLRAFLTINLIGHFTPQVAERALHDPDEYIRGWAIRLATDKAEPDSEMQSEMVRLAKTDPSAVVRLHLASAIQRVPEPTAWELIEALCQHGDDREDRNIPYLVWYGLAQRMTKNLDRAFTVAERTLLPQLSDWIYWYASTQPAGLNRVISRLPSVRGENQRRLLAGIALAVEQGSQPMPAAWKEVSEPLYHSEDRRIRWQAERLAAAFGDDSMFPRLRETLNDKSAEPDSRRHAFDVLTHAQDRGSLELFLHLLDDKSFRSQTLSLLSRFDSMEIPGALLQRYESFSTSERAAALNVLTSRPAFALALLDAVAAGKFKRDQITAYHIRQMLDLKDAELEPRVTANWGKIVQTPGEKKSQIARMEKVFNEAPLWAFDGGAGREHFQKLCAQCHRLGNDGARIGPELTGSNRNGIRYFLENIIDPNAVIGTDFQLTTIETSKGDTLSGIIANETASSVTLRTVTGEVTVPKTEIAQRVTSEKSMMPEGLLESLKDREQIELLKFLTGS